MGRKLVIFDVDGTLLAHPQELIPDSALTALSELRKNGHIIGVASGRDMDTHYSCGYRDVIDPDVIIHLNGARVTDGDDIVFEHRVDDGLLHRLYDFCLEHGISLGMIYKEADYFMIPSWRDKADSYMGIKAARNYRPFEEIFEKNIPVNALCLCGIVEEAREAIEGSFKGVRVVGFNSKYAADVVEEGISKAEGLRRLCSHLGIDISDTYAFGDSQNDVEILDAVGTGIAMGNGMDAAKEHADLIADHIMQDGVYKMCVQLGLIDDVLGLCSGDK